MTGIDHVTQLARDKMAASTAATMLCRNKARTLRKDMYLINHLLNRRENTTAPLAFAKLPVTSSRTLYHKATTLGLSGFNRSRRFPPQTLFNVLHCRFYCSERVCWKCGRNTSPPSELFFCDCGMVQAPADDLDYFSLFGIDFHFDIDTSHLSKMYKDLQRNLHPDKFTQKSEEEKKLADQQSSLVNKAYFILLKPLSRGLYMLDYYGYPIEESTGDVDAEFLMEIMEMNERLDEADSLDEVKEIEEEIGTLIKDITVDISAAFKTKNLTEAKKLMIRYQYFGNMDDKIRERYRKDMN